MSKGAVLVDWRDNVALLTLNRPERRNAVDLESLLLIREAQVEAEKRKIRALVLTGTAPAFCAGADLAGVREEVFHELLSEVLLGFTQLPCVTIAAIDGPALGAGAQLIVACDVRVATPTSVIGVPAAKLGLVVNHWTIERIVREFSWPVAFHVWVQSNDWELLMMRLLGLVTLPSLRHSLFAVTKLRWSRVQASHLLMLWLLRVASKRWQVMMRAREEKHLLKSDHRSSRVRDVN
ncbi:MAG: hypothetical protein GM46_13545 [actinobacterium acAcidi]|nr:MAG: hypothetical protein GM46_13545 [actinobacterium acAcidi]